ncbi:FYVE, RhoGEF and PH domain-containing protein 1, partial [Stegostoma tigrinum]|uniref:FYVE, RhoGEF and PH domain-containing protein 1 n=1 Tax=Stegostoma tigrinum TaxID=3053191 RepID=UPI0028700A6B
MQFNQPRRILLDLPTPNSQLFLPPKLQKMRFSYHGENPQARNAEQRIRPRSPQSQPLVRSLSLDPNSHLEGPQAEPTGCPRISEEMPMPSKRPPGLKPQVPPKPSHLCRTRLSEPIPPAPRRPLPADPRGAPPTPATGRQAGTLARVSTLIDKFE